MKFVEKAEIKTPIRSQEFEFGDLTIFIGRPNSGKTATLNSISNLVNQIKKYAKGIKSKDSGQINWIAANKVELTLGMDIEKINPLLIGTRNGTISNISAYSDDLVGLQKSVQKMDPTISQMGSHGVMQGETHKGLELQGSGLQNLIQIRSQGSDPNFLLIDEPEISQHPSGKIEMLEFIIGNLDKKQKKLKDLKKI